MAKEKRTGVRIFRVLLLAILLFLGFKLNQARGDEGPLAIRDVQVLNTSGHTICQHVYNAVTGTYNLAWQSADLGGTPSVRVGDVDNDGQKEIVASVYYLTRTETVVQGKQRTRIEYFKYRIHVFKNGALNGTPTWSVELDELPNTIINDSYIANVNGDTQKELVLIRSQHLEVYHFQGPGDTSPVCETLRIYPSFLYTLDVGDADNDTQNEIVVVPGYSTALKIWKYTGGTWVEKEADPLPAEYLNKGTAYTTATSLKIRNADNIPGNEIIASGNNERLMVWKYDGSNYRLSSVSQDLIGSSATGVDSGDIDGDLLNEVAIDVGGMGSGKSKVPSRVIVLAFDGGAWVLKNTYVTNYSGQGDLRMGDLDGDGRAEVVFNISGTPAGMKILDFIGPNLVQGAFQQVYAPPAGDPYMDPFVHPEIR